jgi:Ca-activated chloride channel family protein
VRSAVELVSLPVVVLDRKGETVRGLSAGDFEVREQGEPQTIVSFASADTGQPVPLFLGLMLDKSISMERDLDAASSAAVRFAGRLTEARDVTFVEFERTVRLGRYAPVNYPQLFERMRDRRMGWGTVLYDAIGRYVESTRDRAGIHVLVVYTDGGDSMSDLGLPDVLHLLRGGRVILYAIGYMAQAGSSWFDAQALLERLARETGGQAFFPGSTRDLDRIYASILADVAGRYTLGYVPDDPRRDGAYRRVEVRLRSAAGERLTVRTRSGYIAPGSVGRP